MGIMYWMPLVRFCSRWFYSEFLSLLALLLSVVLFVKDLEGKVSSCPKKLEGIWDLEVSLSDEETQPQRILTGLSMSCIYCKTVFPHPSEMWLYLISSFKSNFLVELMRKSNRGTQSRPEMCKISILNVFLWRSFIWILGSCVITAENNKELLLSERQGRQEGKEYTHMKMSDPHWGDALLFVNSCIRFSQIHPWSSGELFKHLSFSPFLIPPLSECCETEHCVTLQMESNKLKLCLRSESIRLNAASQNLH